LPELIIVDKNISLETKNLLGKAMVECLACYGCEFLLLTREWQRKLLALEMNYLTRSARVLRLQQKISNISNSSKMQAEKYILDRIQRKTTEMV
jgi:hypothetical protein